MSHIRMIQALVGRFPSLLGRYTSWCRRRHGIRPRSGRGVFVRGEERRSFARSEIEVELPEGFAAVSQGGSRRWRRGREVVWTWKSDTPALLFLNAGPYSYLEAELGGIRSGSSTIRDTREPRILADASDAVKSFLEEKLAEIEEKTGLSYPFDAISASRFRSRCRS